MYFLAVTCASPFLQVSLANQTGRACCSGVTWLNLSLEEILKVLDDGKNLSRECCCFLPLCCVSFAEVWLIAYVSV